MSAAAIRAVLPAAREKAAGSGVSFHAIVAAAGPQPVDRSGTGEVMP